MHTCYQQQQNCVGPLPKTKKENKYVFSIMCTTSRFPEAIPLRCISAKKIITASTNFFTTFGLPREIQSDQGSNFMSRIFQQAISQMGIKAIQASAYHMQSQGVLERFHSTLKSMMRAYCVEYRKKWDEGLPFCDVWSEVAVQESLGYSPFKLMYGHSVRGALKMIKEK